MIQITQQVKQDNKTQKMH